MLHLEDYCRKLNANRVCGLPKGPPSSNFRVVATIPAVAKMTRQLQFLDCRLVVVSQIRGCWAPFGT